MRNYKRFISYLYAYESGRKLSNVGFARIETSDEVCKITLHCTTKIIPKKECKIYLLKRSKATIVSKQVGIAHSQNGFIDIKLSFIGGRIENADFNVKDTQGIVLMYSVDNYIAAKWDDSIVSYHEATLIEKGESLAIPESKVKKVQSIAGDMEISSRLRAASLEHEIQFVDASDIISVKEEVTRTYEETQIEHQDLRDINSSEESSSKVDEHVLVGEDEQSLVQEKTQGNSQRQDQEKTQGNSQRQDQEKTQGNSQRLGQEVVQGRDLRVKHRDMDFFFQDREGNYQDSYEGNQTVKSRIDEINEEVKEKIKTLHLEQEKVLKEEKVVSQSKKEDEFSQVNKIIEYDYPRDEDKNNYFMNGYEGDYSEEENEGNNFIEEAEDDNIMDENENYKETWNHQEEAQEESDQLQAANCAAPNPSLWADHPSARAILNRFVRMYPFDDGEIAECVRLEPKDIGLLPMSAWVLGNNSFLLHSYCNFRHLLFAKKLTREGCVYLLMVPGAHNNREQQLARMFGFEQFKCSRRRCIRDGEFGYWYVTIDFD